MTSFSIDEREKQELFEESERGLLGVLKSERTNDSTLQRQFVDHFDHFRAEYTQLSVKLRENMRLQRRLMDKCLQLKDNLVVCALRIKATEQAHAHEIKSLAFYRDECERMWKQSALGQERERDARRIIEELKIKVAGLQAQVMTLMGNHAVAAPSPSNQQISTTTRQADRPLGSSLAPESAIQPAKGLKCRSNGPSKAFTMPVLLSFDEWRSSTSLWCPATPLAMGDSPRAIPPLKIYASERSQDISRCSSVPTLALLSTERKSTPLQKGVNATEFSHATRARTAPAHSAFVHSPLERPIVRRGGTPAIKRRGPRQLAHPF